VYTTRMNHAWCLDLFEGIARDLAGGYKGFPVTNLDPLDDADTRAEALAGILSASPAGRVQIAQAHRHTPLVQAANVVVAGVAQIILTPTGAMVCFETTRTAHEALAQRTLVDAILSHLRRTADAAKDTP
jgi:hypothetical protein